MSRRYSDSSCCSARRLYYSWASYPRRRPGAVDDCKNDSGCFRTSEPARTSRRTALIYHVTWNQNCFENVSCKYLAITGALSLILVNYEHGSIVPHNPVRHSTRDRSIGHGRAVTSTSQHHQYCSHKMKATRGVQRASPRVSGSGPKRQNRQQCDTWSKS